MLLKPAVVTMLKLLLFFAWTEHLMACTFWHVATTERVSDEWLAWSETSKAITSWNLDKDLDDAHISLHEFTEFVKRARAEA